MKPDQFNLLMTKLINVDVPLLVLNVKDLVTMDDLQFSEYARAVSSGDDLRGLLLTISYSERISALRWKLLGQSFAQMKMLHYLAVKYIGLYEHSAKQSTVIWDSLANITNLKSFCVSNSHLGEINGDRDAKELDAFCKVLIHQKQLEYLDLTDCNLGFFSDEALKEFVTLCLGLKKLTSINLSMNHLYLFNKTKWTILNDALIKMEYLTTILLAGNCLGDMDNPGWEAFSSLFSKKINWVEIDMEDNTLYKRIPNLSINLKNINNLSSLNLNNNHILESSDLTDLQVTFTKQESLRHLQLLDDFIDILRPVENVLMLLAKTYSSIKNLTTLSINDHNWSLLCDKDWKQFLDMLIQCQNISSLNLSNNYLCNWSVRLVFEMTNTILEMNNLTDINLSSNNLTLSRLSLLLKELSKHPKIRSMNFDNHYFLNLHEDLILSPLDPVDLNFKMEMLECSLEEVWADCCESLMEFQELRCINLRNTDLSPDQYYYLLDRLNKKSNLLLDVVTDRRDINEAFSQRTIGQLAKIGLNFMQCFSIELVLEIMEYLISDINMLQGILKQRFTFRTLSNPNEEEYRVLKIYPWGEQSVLLKFELINWVHKWSCFLENCQENSTQFFFSEASYFPFDSKDCLTFLEQMAKRVYPIAKYTFFSTEGNPSKTYQTFLNLFSNKDSASYEILKQVLLALDIKENRTLLLNGMQKRYKVSDDLLAEKYLYEIMMICKRSIALDERTTSTILISKKHIREEGEYEENQVKRFKF